MSEKTGASLNRGGSRQDYETPEDFLNACARRFGYMVFDLAATNANKKAPHCFTPEMDSLMLEWATMTRGSLCFLNPPFSAITPWAKKCQEEAERGAKILFLVPASVGANWYRDHVHNHAAVLALNGRVTFVGQEDPYPRDLILACYGFGVTGFNIWSWQK